MEGMYGRLEPKPAEPSYTPEERAAMRRAAEAGKAAARAALTGCGGAAYAAVELPPQLSLDCQRYKWRQSQSHVEVFVPLPEGLPARRVSVQLSTAAIRVEVDEAPVLRGRLYREIKAEESTWYIQVGWGGGVLVDGLCSLRSGAARRAGGRRCAGLAEELRFAVVHRAKPPCDTPRLLLPHPHPRPHPP